MPTPSLDYAARFKRIEDLLIEYQWLWRPQPFCEARPAWCDRLPELTEQLLGLDDEQFYGAWNSPEQLLQLLSLPALNELAELTEVESLSSSLPQDYPGFLAWDIPGRKWQQIEAFVAAFKPTSKPLLEWCGGKGHLGRMLGFQHHLPVHTLELNQKLCDEGGRLAGRAKVEQKFECLDVFSPLSSATISSYHPVALHACGGLHRHLLRESVSHHVAALDFVPCCYHLHGDEQYPPFNEGVTLALSRDDLRLAVTETVTASARESRQRDQEMAWKLAYGELRNQLLDHQGYLPVKPIDKKWLRLGFKGFCHKLAERDRLELGEGHDWDGLEAYGWQRQREVLRLSLPRYAFRRALEMWLVLDMVVYLQDKGYQVRLSRFCERSLTPRNLMISARLRG